MSMLPTPVAQTTTRLPAVMARATEAVTIVTGGAGFLGSHLCSQRAISFDWHANRTTAAPHSTTATRSRSAPGRGSYICTAAGSGQMSRCVARIPVLTAVAG